VHQPSRALDTSNSCCNEDSTVQNSIILRFINVFSTRFDNYGWLFTITKLYRLEIVEWLTTDFENTSVSNVINKEYPVPFLYPFGSSLLGRTKTHHEIVLIHFIFFVQYWAHFVHNPTSMLHCYVSRSTLCPQVHIRSGGHEFK